MNKKLTVIICVVFFSINSYGQEPKNKKMYSLFEIVSIARTQSIASKQAETTKENRYWSYQQFKSQYYPELGFDGVLPNFTRSFDNVRQPDGSYDFLPVSINNSNINFRLSQNIGLTGGEVFLNSSVSRADNFATDETVYSGNPLEIGFIQPIFAFNRLRWDQKIEPLRYEESQRQYVEDLENISINVVRNYFDLILAQISLEIAQKNLANNDTIYQIAQGRYNLGKLGEDQILQLELSLMNSRQEVEQSKLDLQTFSLRLRSFAGMNVDSDFGLILPEEIPSFLVDEDLALEEAFKNKQESISFDRRKLEADRETAMAKGNAGLNMDFFGRFGFTNRGDKIGEIYQDTENQQVVSLGFEIPIIDWGRRKSSLKTAEANQKLVQYTVAMEEINFRESVLAQVRQFNMLRESIKISRKADEIADKRYEIAKQRYLIGKIGITDLSIAMREKDEAKQKYIQALRDFWIAYYNLRSLTLYDFEKSVTLTVPEQTYD